MLKRYSIILILSSIIGVLSLAAVITVIILWLTVLTPFQDYALVVDAGSTQTKMYLYSWPADKSDGLGTTSKVTQVKSCIPTGTAVSSIDITKVDSVKDYFHSSMTECLNEIPSTRKSRTLIFLGATAGLRLINITNSAYITNLLNNIRQYFNTLGLLFRAPENQVRIIDGSEEGLAGWITANMLKRQLFENNQPLQTYGVFDMGGASTQISFTAPDAKNERYTLNLFNTNYDVYSHSYLCYGQEQIRLIHQGQLVQQANGSTVVDDPCLQAGYNQTMAYNTINNTACAIQRYVAPIGFNTSANVTFRGTGNYTQCQVMIRQRFNKSSCSSSLNCSFDGIYQPLPLSSSLKLIAISAFYTSFNTFAGYIPLTADSNGNYALSSTNLTQINLILERICNQPWSNLSNPEPRFRPFLCFNSMYHWTLFQYGYSMTDANIKNFQFVTRIDSNQINWALGYMINQTNYLDPEYRPRRLLTREEFLGILICFLVLFVLSILLICLTIFFHLRRQKSPS